jgi:hypothetical protein
MILGMFYGRSIVLLSVPAKNNSVPVRRDGEDDDYGSSKRSALLLIQGVCTHVSPISLHGRNT